MPFSIIDTESLPLPFYNYRQRSKVNRKMKFTNTDLKEIFSFPVGIKFFLTRLSSQKAKATNQKVEQFRWSFISYLTKNGFSLDWKRLSNSHTIKSDFQSLFVPTGNNLSAMYRLDSCAHKVFYKLPKDLLFTNNPWPRWQKKSWLKPQIRWNTDKHQQPQQHQQPDLAKNQKQK